MPASARGGGAAACLLLLAAAATRTKKLQMSICVHRTGDHVEEVKVPGGHVEWRGAPPEEEIEQFYHPTLRRKKWRHTHRQRQHNESITHIITTKTRHKPHRLSRCCCTPLSLPNVKHAHARTASPVHTGSSQESETNIRATADRHRAGSRQAGRLTEGGREEHIPTR